MPSAYLLNLRIFKKAKHCALFSGKKREDLSITLSTDGEILQPKLAPCGY
jgi:hypothetical protein